MNKKMFRVVLLVIISVAGIYLTGPSPSKAEYDLELPNVPSEAAKLESYVNAKESQHRLKVDNEAEIVWKNDSLKNKTEYSLLYLHGYTASKFEGEPVHRDFAKKYGMNAYLARLSGHGIDTSDELLYYTPDALWGSAKRALAIAKQLGNKVIIMSTSTGGTLALKLASEYPEIVGLINFSPNIRPVDPLAFMLNDPWGLEITRAYFNSDFRTLSNMDDTYQKYWYVKYRIESLVGMQELVESTMIKSTYEKIDIPVLNLYYFHDKEHQDEVVRVSEIKKMHDELRTSNELKRLISVNAQTHVIACEAYSSDLQTVVKHVDSFAEEILKLSEFKK